MKPLPLHLIEKDASLSEKGREPMEPGADASRALEEIITRFDAFIRRAARRHGLAGTDVDDVVQELRVRMWKALGTADVIRTAKPSYIHRAAVSASLDIIRRRSVRRHEVSSLEDVDSLRVDSGRRADADVDRTELAAAVHRALSLLVESRRAVVRMHLAGYERDEIAELLGWSEAKTRNLLYRGLEDLRALLAARGIGPGAAV